MILDTDLNWLGHSGFLLKSKEGKTIYIDPYHITSTEISKADLILITHEHYDHCSMADVKKIAKPETIIISVAGCQSKLSGIKFKAFVIVKPGDKLNMAEFNLQIEAVPAYNTNKKFHPKENGWLGFILTLNRKRIYHAGDTDLIPEMNNFKNIDIALLPISGTYVMTAEEAAKACSIIKPKLAIPMHYGSGVVGTDSDAKNFESLAKLSCEVKILNHK